jgi:hypothetical protein
VAADALDALAPGQSTRRRALEDILAAYLAAVFFVPAARMTMEDPAAKSGTDDRIVGTGPGIGDMTLYSRDVAIHQLGLPGRSIFDWSQDPPLVVAAFGVSTPAKIPQAAIDQDDELWRRRPGDWIFEEAA